MAKLQGHMPFVLTEVIEQYFNILIQLFLQGNFSVERVTDTIVIALTKPLTTYCYYKNPA